MTEGLYLSGIPLIRSGTPGGSRTPNLLVRSQALYPIELRVQTDLHTTVWVRMSKPKANRTVPKGQIFLKIREALWPPKPELLLMATDTSESRASFGT